MPVRSGRLTLTPGKHQEYSQQTVPGTGVIVTLGKVNTTGTISVVQVDEPPPVFGTRPGIIPRYYYLSEDFEESLDRPIDTEIVALDLTGGTGVNRVTTGTIAGRIPIVTDSFFDLWTKIIPEPGSKADVVRNRVTIMQPDGFSMWVLGPASSFSGPTAVRRWREY